MAEYNEYEYLWPPRPERKIPIQLLQFYEKQKYWAQLKKNGTCTVIFARGNEVIFKTRHDDDHKAWSPLKEHLDFYRGRSDKWNVYVAELLHSKTPTFKNHLYMFDQLVSEGERLDGMKFSDRQALLQSQWTYNEDFGMLMIDKNFSLAKNFTSGFAGIFKQLRPEDEGLVLKDPNATLKGCYRPTSNAGWQVKCRILHANYGF